MAEEFIIRKANLNDLDEILELHFKLSKKIYKKFDKSVNLNWTYTHGKKYFAGQIKKSDGFVEVAEGGGKIIGYVCGSLVERPLDREKALYAELESIMVDKKLRSAGIGSELIKSFLKWSKPKKVKYISVTASDQNEKAVKLYRNLGFKNYEMILELDLKKLSRFFKFFRNKNK